MASTDGELEKQLMEAGNKLLVPPASVDELLPLLDQVENCLLKVEQSPSMSMQNALSASLKALVTDQLLRHSDIDVKVAVAACISEITRITAPDAPYDDDQMKEIFQLIVSSFEKLSDRSSRSYDKRTSILETVAKVRSCVVMLDLECDALIIEMFQHFLNAIRDDHPENVFTSMETIMTLVLEESEDIPTELLSPILASIKKDNQEVLPIARKLGEKVFENCANKLKPCLMQAVKSLGISLDDYSKIVSSICQGTSSTADQNDDGVPEQNDDSGPQQNDDSAPEQKDDNIAGKNTVEESQLLRASSDEAAQVDKEISIEAACPGEADPAMDRSPKSVMSNGIKQAANDDSLVDSNSSKKPDYGTNQSKSSKVPSEVELDSLDVGKVEQESKPEQTTKKRGRKPNSSMNLIEPSDSRVSSEEESEKLSDHKKNQSKAGHDAPCEDPPSMEAAVPSENEKMTATQLSSPKALENESSYVASPSPSRSLPDESHVRKVGRPRKKDNLNQEVGKRRPGKRAGSGITEEDKTSATMTDSVENPLKKSGKKVDTSKNEDGSSLKPQEDRKKRGRGKAVLEKEMTKFLSKDDEKEMLSSPKSAAKSVKDESHSEETPKMLSKGKHTSGKRKASDTVDFGENLVGSRIKVWWPKDQMYYEGVIDSFDSEKKKHKVLYVDGDEEILNLKKEKFDFVTMSDGEEATQTPSLDGSEMRQKKKAKFSDVPSKQGKMDASPQKGGGASSSKSKVSVTKSGRKSRDSGKIDGKSKEDSSKNVGKSDDENSGNRKDQKLKGGGKLIYDSPKTASKSKDQDANVPKMTGKSKQDSSKTVSKSKSQPLKSGSRSNANGSSKGKSSSAKGKETVDVKEKSPDSGKSFESAKGKSQETLKEQESETKSGKKRRRAVKS